jgi:hypothetical protein
LEYYAYKGKGSKRGRPSKVEKRREYHQQAQAVLTWQEHLHYLWTRKDFKEHFKLLMVELRVPRVKALYQHDIQKKEREKYKRAKRHNKGRMDREEARHAAYTRTCKALHIKPVYENKKECFVCDHVYNPKLDAPKYRVKSITGHTVHPACWNAYLLRNYPAQYERCKLPLPGEEVQAPVK